jgi:SAM-dependent methyltransferase
MQSVPYERWADYTEALLDATHPDPADLLELCCGTGKFGLAMARRGYRVTGADLSYPMVAEAQRVVTREGTGMDLLVADACALPFEERFDAVVSVFDSLNYITHDGGLEEAFASAYRALRPGGIFAFDMNTVQALEEELFTQSRTGEGERLRYDWVSSWDAKTRLSTIRMRFEWQDGSEVRQFDEVHVQRGYEDEEIREGLAAAGLEVEGAYIAYTLHPLREGASRAYYLAVRPY